ncbi:MAG: mechanosensitive ion channel family protein, partial [Acidobacteriota bacterium]
MEYIESMVTEWLSSIGMEAYAGLLNEVLLGIALIITCLIIYKLSRIILYSVIHKLVEKSGTPWDDVLLKKGFFSRISILVHAAVVYLAAPLLPDIQSIIEHAALASMGLIALISVGALLDSIDAIYRSYEVSRNRPIRGYLQAVKIFLYSLGGIAIIATLIGQSPWKLLSGIGAMTAILILVFKDTIMGFVASIQVNTNNMVNIGDWIEMPKYGADGDVIDIGINCVKVRNFDNTITTIPTYTLVSDSFRNWRGMQESGGRRIKRSIYIDMRSVSFCTDEMLERFRKFAFLSEYIEKKTEEIRIFNENNEFDLSSRVNFRRLTNLVSFSSYIKEYLKENNEI